MSKARNILRSISESSNSFKIVEASDLEFSCMWDDIIGEFESAFDGEFKVVSTGKEIKGAETGPTYKLKSSSITKFNKWMKDNDFKLDDGYLTDDHPE